MTNNTVWQGDNLAIMRERIQPETVDLVYLDPPFGSNRNYNFDMSRDNTRVAFSDTWKWDEETDSQIRTIYRISPTAGILLEGMSGSIGHTPLLTYTVMMTLRLLEIRRVMKTSASLYLHCDPTSSHYLKLVMDCLFGADNFRNEIIWAYKGGGRSTKTFARKHDVILYYTKSETRTFNYQDILVDRTNRTYFTDEDGRKYWLKFGKRYYLKHEGKVPEDWWTDIDPLHGPYNERLGYPTQKPLSLLERIIKASSNPGDTVLDPFCGCGTTLIAAQQLERNWIGIDISQEAIDMTVSRLRDTFTDQTFNIER